MDCSRGAVQTSRGALIAESSGDGPFSSRFCIGLREFVPALGRTRCGSRGANLARRAGTAGRTAPLAQASAAMLGAANVDLPLPGGAMNDESRFDEMKRYVRFTPEDSQRLFEFGRVAHPLSADRG